MPMTMPVHAKVDGLAEPATTSHSTGIDVITTAAAGAAERSEPREYAAYKNRIPTPFITPANPPKTKSPVSYTHLTLPTIYSV